MRERMAEKIKEPNYFGSWVIIKTSKGANNALLNYVKGAKNEIIQKSEPSAVADDSQLIR